MSILSFNTSVSDKNNLSTISEPYQIMPSTQTMLLDRYITAYPTAKLPGLLIHMNYITKPFSPSAIETNSMERKSLRQYVKLAQKLGTKNILIHGPNSLSEYQHLAVGMKVIKDELISSGMKLQMEIPSFTRDLIDHFLGISDNPIKNMLLYLTELSKYLSLFPEGSYGLVPDTAHLYADGIETMEGFETIFTKFKPIIEYVHFNGNINAKYKSDIHCPMFAKSNKITCWKELSSFVSGFNVICIAENTKNKSDYDDWKLFSNEFGFKLVKFNPHMSV